MFETRQARTERVLGMHRLRELEDLGHLLGIMIGPKTPGRKPQGHTSCPASQKERGGQKS